MPHYGVLQRNHAGASEGHEILGSALYGLGDRKLGRIVNAVRDRVTGNIIYFVVDAGGWPVNRKFLVPANLLSESTRHPGDFVADLTPEQIEHFPACDNPEPAEEETQDDLRAPGESERPLRKRVNE